MRKYFFLLLASGFLSVTASAQTKKIAHRSHSGSDRTFSIGGSDNFGLKEPPEKRAKKMKLKKAEPKKDTVKPNTVLPQYTVVRPKRKG